MLQRFPATLFHPWPAEINLNLLCRDHCYHKPTRYSKSDDRSNGRIMARSWYYEEERKEEEACVN